MQVKFFALVFILFFSTVVNSWAQPAKKIEYKTHLPDSVQIINLQDPKQRIKYDKPFKKEISVGIRIPYRGWALFLDYGFLNRKEDYKKFEYDYLYNARSISLEIGERFHSKEDKPGLLSSLMANQPANYTYGKINNLYHAKLMFNNRMLLAGKQNKGNIGVHWIMGIGAVVGFQKPYYLDVASAGTIKYSDSTKIPFLTGMVTGRQAFKGWNEVEIIPGAILKSGFQFDIASKYKRVSIFEIGGTLEYFFSDINLMAEQKPQKLFAGVYLSYQFGKRK